MMRILVYGAGAIGGYLGARLSTANNQVVLFDRPELAEGINKEGIVIEEAGERRHVWPAAVSSLADAYSLNDSYDLILMGLKSYDLPSAMSDLVAYEPSGATILTVQNGIGIEQPFIETFGAGRILAGSLTTPVSKKRPHYLVVERSGRGLGLASTDPGMEIDPWIALFRDAGIEAVAIDDFESMKWSKAFLNIISNATSAILDMPPGAVYRDPDLFDLELAMLRETLAVMARRGLEVVDLPGSSARGLALAVQHAPRLILKPVLTRLVAAGRGDKMPSFYIDLVSGRGQSEVVYHNGAIAAEGEALHVPAPVNAMLNDVLLRLTGGDLDRRDFSRNPRRLLSELATS